MRWVALGIGDAGVRPPPGIAARNGRFACLLLAPSRATGTARVSLQLACHRCMEAFLPLASGLEEVAFDESGVRERLDGVRGRSVVALEPPRPTAPAAANGAAWLHARRAALAARRDDMAALAALSEILPHERAVLTERAGDPLALLLTRTEKCSDLAAAAHAGWSDLVVSAPWPVFGFAGTGSA